VVGTQDLIGVTLQLFSPFSRLTPRCSLRNSRPPPESPSVRCLPLRMVSHLTPKLFTTALSSLIFQLDPEKASFDEEREPRCRGL
jgi:hypothetical protein